VAEPSPPSAPEKPALLPPSPPPADTRAAAGPAEQPAVSTAAPPRAERGDNLPKSPEPKRVEQALEPEQQQIASSQTSAVADEREELDPTVRDLITRGWELYYLPYSAARWQNARRNFERALELDSRSSEARIGLASILSTKISGWMVPCSSGRLAAGREYRSLISSDRSPQICSAR
jgi:hypothetical protein